MTATATATAPSPSVPGLVGNTGAAPQQSPGQVTKDFSAIVQLFLQSVTGKELQQQGQDDQQVPTPADETAPTGSDPVPKVVGLPFACPPLISTDQGPVARKGQESDDEEEDPHGDTVKEIPWLAATALPEILPLQPAPVPLAVVPSSQPEPEPNTASDTAATKTAAAPRAAIAMVLPQQPAPHATEIKNATAPAQAATSTVQRTGEVEPAAPEQQQSVDAFRIEVRSKESPARKAGKDELQAEPAASHGTDQAEKTLNSNSQGSGNSDNGSSEQRGAAARSGNSETAQHPAKAAPRPSDPRISVPPGEVPGRSAPPHTTPLTQAAPVAEKPAEPTSSQPAQPSEAPRPAADTVRQIEALRFSGVNLGARSQPVQDLELHLPASGGLVDVRLSDRGGRVEISVRTADPQLAQDLRQQLPDLVDSLETRGYAASSGDKSKADNAPPVVMTQRSAYDSADGDPGSQRRDRQSQANGRKNRNNRREDTEFQIDPSYFQTGNL